jgi:hypothetical protein
MANTDKNIIITPNVGSETDDPTIVFSAANTSFGPANITLTTSANNSGSLTFASNTSNIVTMLVNGNVGLGTTNPTSLLDVNGNVKSTTFNGNLVGNVTATTVTATGNVSGGNLTTGGLVSATGTVTGGNLSTGGTLSVTGNSNVGNLGTGGLITATGNITGGNLITTGLTQSGTLNVTGNSNVGNLGATGVFATTVTATGNVTGGNLVTSGVITATGNVSGNFFVGNGSQLSGVTATNVGTLATLNVTGNSNVGNLGTGGLITATGNVSGGNLVTSGVLSVTGNANVGNLGATGAFVTTITATGNVTGGNFILSSGTANGVAYLNASNVLTTGTNLTFDGSLLTVNGNIQQTWATSMDRFIGTKFSNTYELGLHFLEAGRETQIVSKAADSTDKITFFTGVTPTEKMRVDTSGNVGIGTNSPVAKLDIGSSVDAQKLLLYSSGNVRYGFGIQTDTLRYFVPAGSAIHSFGTISSTDGSTYTERMRLDSSGNLGVGTNSPQSKLDVRGYIVAGNEVSTIGSKILGGYYSTAHIVTLGGEYSSGGPVLGYAVWPSPSAAGSFVSSTSVSVQRGAYTINGLSHVWYGGASQTVAVDSAVTVSEYMRLNSTGLGIGTASPVVKLHVVGTQSVIQNTSPAYSLWKDSTPTKAARFGFNISVADGLELGLYDGSAWATNLVINPSGYVGIGTISPASPLDVIKTGVQLGTTAAYLIARTRESGATKGVSLGYDSGSQTGIVMGDTASGSSNLAFWTFESGASGWAERMRITGSGNVGIGTLGFAARGNLDISVGNDTSTQTRQIHFGYSAADYYGWKISNTNSPGVTAAGTISFQRGTTSAWVDAVLINDSGNFGIGTNSPGARLHVDSGATDEVARFVSTGDPYISLYDTATRQMYIGSTGSSECIIWVETNKGLRFATNNTERARIDSSGNFLVGTATVGAGVGATFRNTVVSASGSDGLVVSCSGAAAANIPLAVVNTSTSGDSVISNFYTEATPTIRGSITYNRAGGLIAYNTTSDYRAKEIFGPVVNSGAIIDTLKVYTGKMLGAAIERPMLVAHETQSVAPYAVTGEKDAVNEDGTPKFQQMDMSSLVPLLIAEIQSLRARVATLESNQ